MSILHLLGGAAAGYVAAKLLSDDKKEDAGDLAFTVGQAYVALRVAEDAEIDLDERRDALQEADYLAHVAQQEATKLGASSALMEIRFLQTHIEEAMEDIGVPDEDEDGDEDGDEEE